MADITELAGMLAGFDVVDLSPTVTAGMAGWPTHPPVEIIRDARTFARDGYFLQTLILPEHSGCHVDAPIHVHEAMTEATIDSFAADCLFGPAKKFDASGLGLQAGALLSLDGFLALAERDGIAAQAGDIVLVDFGWERYARQGATGPSGEPAGPRWWGGNEPGFAADLCRYLAEHEVKAVGTDTAACDIASVGGQVIAGHGHGTYFLPRGILIIEGLCSLASLPATCYFLALPLRIAGGSGSPLRPVALVPRPGVWDCKG
jgi:arylformamidase